MSSPSTTPPSGLDANLAVKQLRSDPEWLFKVGFGGVLTAACLLLALLDLQHLLLVPVALAISALLCGYLLRVVRSRVKTPDSEKMPDWSDWMDLFMSGITWISIQFCLLVFACSIITTSMLLAYYAMLSKAASTLAIMESTLLAVLLTVFWTHFISTFLWLNFAVEERVSAGLAIRDVARKIRSNPKLFWSAWALSTAIQFTAVILPSITLIGVFLVPSTLFASQLLSANLLALAWRAADAPEAAQPKVKP